MHGTTCVQAPDITWSVAKQHINTTHRAACCSSFIANSSMSSTFLWRHLCAAARFFSRLQMMHDDRQMS